MSDPSVTVAEAFKQFSQVTVAAVRRDCDFHPPPPTHSPSAARLRAWDSCATQPGRGRSVRPATRTGRLAEGPQCLQGAKSGVGRRCEPVEGRGACLPRITLCHLSPSPFFHAYPTASLQADSALLVVKIAHPIELFWESPKLTSPPPFFPALNIAEQAPGRTNRAAPPGGATMERPVFAR